MPLLSRSDYAKHRGVSISAISKHIRAGVLAGAIGGDGRINARKADRLLDQSITGGLTVPVELADARRRKLAASVALLKAKVDAIEASVLPKAEAAAGLRSFSLNIAAYSYEVARTTAAAVAGKPTLAAFSSLTDAIYEMLTKLSEAEIVSDESKVTQAQPPRLAQMSAVALATLKNNLEARRFEIEQQLADGTFVSAESVLNRDLVTRLLAARQHFLAMPSKVAPLMTASTPAEAQGILTDAFGDALAELACWSVSESELREVEFGQQLA
jgi:hypothetical protein